MTGTNVEARVDSDGHHKDAVLDELARVANVAQFVSFSANRQPKERYSRVRGFSPNHKFGSVSSAVGALMDGSNGGSVNVRSYHPQSPQAHEFIYGLADPQDAIESVVRLGSMGLNTIVNETIDVNDGGVSGVTYGSLVEFAPGDTPRAVEKPGVVSIELESGLQLLELVYGFALPLEPDPGTRVEFSIHPLRQGFRQEHFIVWEMQRIGEARLSERIQWPNHFSRHLGDKAFGLLIAHVLGEMVPKTNVFARGLPPFAFGQSTDTGETWLRTCPHEPVPGKFTTKRGWADPFALLAQEDPTSEQIASILAQEGIRAEYSGALLVSFDGSITLEGAEGSGELFMQGRAAPGRLPPEVVRDIQDVEKRLSARLGPVRFEWVHDGKTAWIVQLHQGAVPTQGRTIYPGKPSREHRLRVNAGLEAIRDLANRLRGTGEGIVLVGDVGVTSHIGDVLRRAQVPSRLEPASFDDQSQS